MVSPDSDTGSFDDVSRCTCPICDGQMSEEFVEDIKRAAEQMGPPMTADQFLEWLCKLDT